MSHKADSINIKRAKLNCIKLLSDEALLLIDSMMSQCECSIEKKCILILVGFRSRRIRIY